MVSYRRVRLLCHILTASIHIVSRLGSTMRSAYILTFQTQLFSILPPSFLRGFKALCASTLSTSSLDASTPPPSLWEELETLGLIDRYEAIIASVGYEHIEQHVLSNCTGKWAEPMLVDLRSWMTDTIVPWMLKMYVRGAATRSCSCLSVTVTTNFDY